MFTMQRSNIRRVRNPRYAPEWLESKLSPSGFSAPVMEPPPYVEPITSFEPPPPPPDVLPPTDPAGPAGPA